MDANASATMAVRTTATLPPPTPTSSFFSELRPFRLQHQPRQPRKPHLLKSLKCIPSPPPDIPNSRNSASPFSCSAVSFLPSKTADAVPSKLRCLVDEFQSLSEPVDRVKRLLHYATLLPPVDESARVDSNRVMGCTARVWLEVRIDEEGKGRFGADSDSEITRGFCSCLVWLLDGSAPEEVLKLVTDDLVALNVGLPSTARSRVNTWHNVLVSMQKRTKQLIAEREGKKVSFELFPSLSVTPDGVHPKGSYAEAQVIA